jgi:diaminopimelate epimerase
MRLRFTKMQGAGNDFIVLDATRAPVALDATLARRLADRHFGIGADQILLIGPPPSAAADFGYRIFNSGGGEVEHCGNGARCFLRFVRARGLTDRRRVRVQTMNRLLELVERDDGRVQVDMGAPVFDAPQVPFDPTGLAPQGPASDRLPLWPLSLPDGSSVQVAVVSMGNPHAVQRVDDVDSAPVARVGPWVEGHERFPRRVNAGFLQVVSPTRVRLRVYERGAGETLACGTGACAAVAAGVGLGWLQAGADVDVETRGGLLTIAWAGTQGPTSPVYMTGPAEFVFEGEIEL